MEFKRLLLKYRAENGMTQEELGKYLGFPRQRINEWETGAAKPYKVNEMKVRMKLGEEEDGI